MADLDVKLFTDEMINPKLAVALQSYGYDVLSAHAAGRANQKISDEDQLDFATKDGRAILTDNVTDFTACVLRWMQLGRTHAGVVICRQVPFSALLRRVTQHLDLTDPQVQQNALLYLAP
jgi:predicted nuclease of predicted toxin-antitoxin system